MYRRKWLISIILLLAVLLMAACGRGRSEPTATPTKTPNTAQTGQGGAPAQENTPTPVPAVAGAAATQAPPAAAAQQPAAAATATPATKTVVTINAPILNVRRSPAADGELVQTVNQGEQYDVIGRSQDGQWVQIGTGGREMGWVSSQYVQEQTVSLQTAAATNGGDNGGQASGSTPAAAADTPAPAVVQAPAGIYLPATMNQADFGAQAFLWWKPEIADRDLTLMQDADFHWVKQTFAWEEIEPFAKGGFKWDNADKAVQLVNKHQLKLLARVSMDPNKAGFWAGTPPGNGDNFADFLFALASRYNCTAQAVGCIQAFQVWNEPNLAREWGGAAPNPAQYVDFLHKAYAAIKRGNPNAIVINAGMAPTGDNNGNAMPDDVFYDGMYQAMANHSSDGYFDMLGVHAAGFAAPPELDPAQAAADKKYGGYRFFAFRHVEDIRAIMQKYGDNKDMVLLEFGWTYDQVNEAYKWHGADAGITDMVQGDYLQRAYKYAKANWPYVKLMSLLTMPNLDWLNDGNPKDEEQYWWAIMDPSPIDKLYLRPAFVILCEYFNGQDGKTCKYAPK